MILRILTATVLAISSLLSTSPPMQGVNVHPTNSCQIVAPGELVRMDIHLDWFPGAQWVGYQATLDSCVASIRAAGARPVAVVLGDPNPTSYSSRVAALAQRWPGVAWEIWNEPNDPRFSMGTPAQYVALLRAAAAAIRAVDSTASVISAGLAWPECNTWLGEMYQAGLASVHVDAVALHPYWAVSDWAAKITAFRRVMTTYNDHAPVWLTEFGWFGSTQASAFKTVLPVLATLPYVRAAIWYDLDRLGA